MIRKDVNFKGLSLPGLKDPLKAKFFADDTSVYLSKDDTFDLVEMLLEDWCTVSGAKFNIGKTEVIPIGSEDHRKSVVMTRKISQQDKKCLNEHIKIAEDGNAIRFLGAWIGNHTKDAIPWEPVIDRVHKRLERWATSYPTLMGRKLIIQSVVGGHTQFLTMAQGMPTNIEDALIKITRRFIWGADSSPRLALDVLYCPVEEGGLNLLDITARNEAIEIMWLKSHLDLSPARPAWAVVTDLLIDMTAPPATNQDARENNFLQTWNPATRGQRAKLMGKDSTRMLKVARKYNINLEALRLTTQLRAQLPAWYHIAAPPRPLTGITAKCLLGTHQNTTVAHLLKTSMRIRNPNENPQSPHSPRMFCYCQDCSSDRMKGCRNPHACATEAQTRLEQIFPKFNPLSPGHAHGNLSLTKRRKRRNAIAKPLNGEILFDPTITSREDLSECFRIFTDPKRISSNPARRDAPHDTRLNLKELTVYTDGACINNGKEDAKCGSGVWFGPNHRMNRAMRIPGRAQSNQIGELSAVIAAIEAAPTNQPLKIITDSRYVIEGLTDNLRQWEDRGWIGVQNANFFKRAAFLMRKRTARTSFQWIKGHTGDQGNEGSDQLAKSGAEKEEPDALDLNIPIEFDLQGAKLATLTQSEAYRGIRERQKTPYRKSTETNLKKTRAALHDYNGELETDASIWKSTRNPVIRLKIRQFLFRMMHQTPKVGGFWSKIPKWEHRQTCVPCQTVESMKHILVECRSSERRIIWQLTEQIWPHGRTPLPEISFGIILGVGAISPPATPANDGETNPRKTNKGARRLMQILISESAHLIWVLRCERVIQGKEHSDLEIVKRWLRVINKRLIEDKITATKIKRDNTHIKLTQTTWEAILTKEGELPDKWMTNGEVLVGRRI
jgi:ribonuclease HI